MSQTVNVRVLVDHWGYWNGQITESLAKGDIRENVDRGHAERAAALGEVEILDGKAASVSEKPEQAVPENPAKEDLSHKTVAQLRKLAEERKIDLGDAKKKADILKKFEG